MKTILVTGIGAPGAPSIIKHMKKYVTDCKIIGVDANIQYCAAKQYVDRFIQIPKASDATFFNTILHLITTHDVNYIISLVTDELYILSKYKEYLQSLNVNIYISSFETIQKIANKHLLYEALKSSLDLPQYKLINLRSIVNHLSEFDYPNKNVCFKPLTYDGARGFRVITNKVNRLEQLITQKPYNFYISVEELNVLFEQSSYDCQVLLSEYLPGTEYTVDTFVKNNSIQSISIRERIKLKNHISFVGKTIKNENIEAQIHTINSKFDLEGSIGYQFKNDELGVPKLLECNPRLQGATILSCHNNYDYILANVDIYRSPENNNSVTMLRYFDEIFEYEL